MTSKPWVTLTLASISCLLLLYHLLSPWSIINVNISLALQWCSTQLSVACSKAKSLTVTMESMMAQSFQGTWEHGLLHHSVALDGKSCIDTTIRSSLQWRSKSSQAYMSIVELTLYRIASSVSSRSVVSVCWEDGFGASVILTLTQVWWPFALLMVRGLHCIFFFYDGQPSTPTILITSVPSRSNFFISPIFINYLHLLFIYLFIF